MQEYAKELIDRGVEVWICTARIEDCILFKNWNDDLFKVANELGIPKERILFTPRTPKWKVLSEDFVFHLDDDWYELKEMQRSSKITAISSWGSPKWKSKCEKAIKKYEKRIENE